MSERRRLLLALALAAGAALAAALLTARPGDPRLYPPGPQDARTGIFLVDNGFHVDLAIPREDVARSDGPLARAADALGPGPWVETGWGDERFYQEQGFSLARAIDGARALFWPANRSVVRVEVLRAPPDRIYLTSGLTRLSLSKAGARRMLDRIDRSLLAGRGQPIRVGSRRIAAEGFFRSSERFSVLRLCNHWTADMLGAAGVPTTPVLDTLAQGLLLDLRLRAGARPHAAAAAQAQARSARPR
jgi:uncharacterized protein (TIGR02117 family)